jgi:excisionase family DNA binding protein
MPAEQTEIEFHLQSEALQHEVRPAVGPCSESLPLWLTPRETAAVLRLSVNSVYAALRNKTLPAKRIGWVLRIPREALECKELLDALHESLMQTKMRSTKHRAGALLRSRAEGQ